jgi:hypothetical protein
MEDVDTYWRAVQDRVCSKCIDSDGLGNCRLSGDEDCGLRLHFPRIVETVLSVQSERLEPYIDALRRDVCTYCRHQSPDGTCQFRVHADCGLDRYFPLVVEAIEEVRSNTPDVPESFREDR